MLTPKFQSLCEAMRAKGEKTYRCFVEDCDKVCSTPQKRQMHLIDKHMFPKASVDLLLHEILTIFKRYDFWIVNTGVDKRSSMLRSKHRKNSTAATRAIYREHCTGDAQASPSLSKIRPEALEQSPVNDSKATNSTTSSIPSQDADVDELASTMSALKFVPPSVRFGRGGRRGGLSGS